MTAYSYTSDVVVTAASTNAIPTITTFDYVYIAQGANISSSGAGGNGIRGESNDRVTVEGDIFAEFIGIWFSGASGSNNIVVSASGSVVGLSYGIYDEGSNNRITNAGTIASLDGITLAGGNSYISNSGLIQGESYAIYLNGAATETNKLINSGEISSSSTALSFHDAADTVINTGLISGDIRLGSNDDVLDSHLGVLVGSVFAGEGNDTLVGGASNDELHGEDGSDTLEGGAGNDKLDGGAGVDALEGGEGNDTYYVDNAADLISEDANQGKLDWVATSISFTLDSAASIEKFSTTSSGGTTAITLTGNEFVQIIVGNAGANSINGRQGNDTLTGGAGADSFVFNTPLSSSANLDRITDFSVVDDTIKLENAVFTAITGTGTLTADQFFKNTTGIAHDASDHIIYETDTGRLYYDSNGNAAGGNVLFATIGTNLALTNADFTVI